MYFVGYEEHHQRLSYTLARFIDSWVGAFFAGTTPSGQVALGTRRGCRHDGNRLVRPRHARTAMGAAHPPRRFARDTGIAAEGVTFRHA